MLRIILITLFITVIPAADSYTVVCLEKIQDSEKKLLYAVVRNGHPVFAIYARGNSEHSIIYNASDPDNSNFAIMINLDNLDAELNPATYGASLALMSGGRAVMGSDKKIEKLSMQLGTSRLVISLVPEAPMQPTRLQLLKEGFVDTIGRASLPVP